MLQYNIANDDLPGLYAAQLFYTCREFAYLHCSNNSKPRYNAAVPVGSSSIVFQTKIRSCTWLPEYISALQRAGLDDVTGILKRFKEAGLDLSEEKKINRFRNTALQIRYVQQYGTCVFSSVLTLVKWQGQEVESQCHETRNQRGMFHTCRGQVSLQEARVTLDERGWFRTIDATHRAGRGYWWQRALISRASAAHPRQRLLEATHSKLYQRQSSECIACLKSIAGDIRLARHIRRRSCAGTDVAPGERWAQRNFTADVDRAEALNQ